MAVRFSQFTRGLTRLSFRAWLGIGLALLFFGDMFWAKERDPFQRIWFTVKTANFGKVECIAVLPKTASKPLPVILYLHGSGGSMLGSGNDLRQMAEMGLAAVGMEYSQTNEAAFAEQFIALNQYLARHTWADPNKIAWVGYSLGAQRQLSFAWEHPELRPRLLARLAGGWVPELEAPAHRNPAIEHSTASAPHPGPLPSAERVAAAPSVFASQPSKVLLIHGEKDDVFSVAEARRVASALRTNEFPVDLRTMAGQAHSLAPNQEVLFRGIGEYVLHFFQGESAFQSYQSIATWQENAKSLWPFWIPAALWLLAGWFSTRSRRRAEALSEKTEIRNPKTEIGMSLLTSAATAAKKLTRWEAALRWLAGVMVMVALGVTALHLIPPQLEITAGRLAFARKHLLAPKEPPDFAYLSTNTVWAGKKLKTLLEHVELANYNRELVNWKLDDDVYRHFVLSVQIDPLRDGDFHWRRRLWESFYPRIRKEDSPASAAEIIVRHLRARVTIVPGPHPVASIAEIWTRQITDESGFEAIYLAALRSAGVAARLDGRHHAEFWAGTEWKPAPRPMIGSLIR